MDPKRRWGVEWLPLSTLKENPNNPRTHADKDLKELRASIRRYGPRWPILVDNFNDRNIIAGHGRKSAAVLEGHEDWQCVDATDLTKEEQEEFSLVDNRVPELSKWDE